MPAFNTFVGGYELDAYWADARLAIEFDGFRSHHTTRRFYTDRRRDLELAELDIQVNRLTWRDFEDEAALAASLRRVRAARLRRLTS